MTNVLNTTKDVEKIIEDIRCDPRFKEHGSIAVVQRDLSWTISHIEEYAGSKFTLESATFENFRTDAIAAKLLDYSLFK